MPDKKLIIIIGESGEGKRHLLILLIRLYEPDSGQYPH